MSLANRKCKYNESGRDYRRPKFGEHPGNPASVVMVIANADQAKDNEAGDKMPNYRVRFDWNTHAHLSQIARIATS
jgi:hypothetical protein